MIPIQSTQAHSGDELVCYWAENTPIIDGNIETGEWDDAKKYLTYLQNNEEPYKHLETYVYLKNDNDYLYILLDAVGDTDFENKIIRIFFDVDHDGMRKAFRDVKLTFAYATLAANPGGAMACEEWNGTNFDSKEGGNWSGGKHDSTSPDSPQPHFIFELYIPLIAWLKNTDLSTVGLMLDYCWYFADHYNWPENSDKDNLNSYGDLILSTGPPESIPPNLTVLVPGIDGLTVIVNGVVFPGTEGTHIERIHWNWDDGYEEDHWFAASHTYSDSETSPQTYTITVTAHQSDGLTTTKTKILNTLRIDASSGGHTDPPAFSYLFNTEDEVYVSAYPDVHYTFGHWIKDGYDVGSDNPIRVIMNTGHALKPIFEAIAEELPTAYIDSISPNPSGEGENVHFEGHGIDRDGYIVDYRWDSSIDGFLSDQSSFSTNSISIGTHIIHFKVKDDDNQWSSPAEETLTMTQLQGEIVDLDKEDVKGVYEVHEKIDFIVGIKNTGDVDGTFWVRYMFLSPGTTATTHYGSPKPVYVESGETVQKSLLWTVPYDASAGAYSLLVYLYDRDPGNLETRTLDIESIPCALMIDRDASYIQIETISSFTGEQRAIHVHIADHDIEESGTLTFNVVVSALQLAKVAVGTGGTSYAAMLGRGLNAIKTAWGISNRAVKLVENGTADILVLQFIGEIGFLYEASLLDIGSIVWRVTATPIPKEYLEMSSPYFSEIQFEWTLVSYMQIMETYFPCWKFSENEQWYPCSFYFDDNTDLADNKNNHEGGEFDDPATERPPYYVYIHIEMDKDYLAIQYWLYFVYSDWRGDQFDHMHDWDARVYVIFDRNDLETPVKVGFSYHIWSYTCDWDDPDIEYQLEKVDTHVVAYIAEGSHGSYHSKSAMVLVQDIFEPEGITLGYEDIRNWVITGNCKKETPTRDFCLVDYFNYNCEHPIPSDAIIDDEIYWPKDFGDVPAAWHQDLIWRNTIPPLTDILAIEAHSPVDIGIQDSLGRYIGVDENGVVRYEIPDTMYTGPGAEPEVIIINEPSGEYVVFVYGVDDGTFNLAVWEKSNRSTTLIKEFTEVSIQEDQVVSYALQDFSPTDITPEPFPPWIVATIVLIIGLGTLMTYFRKFKKRSSTL